MHPTSATLHADVGQRIELRVDSDSADAIQVDVDYDYTYTVAPEQNQILSFTAGDPGVVTIGMRDRGHTVATIQVRE